jgi:hypothetical protein
MNGWRAAITAWAGLAGLLASGYVPAQSYPSERIVLLGQSATFSFDAPPIRGLYPGATKRIPLTVLNPSREQLTLRNLEGRLVSTSRRGCPANASTLRVGHYEGRLPVVIPAGRRMRLPGSIAVTMSRTATPRCAGTRFTIRLTGVATGDRR